MNLVTNMNLSFETLKEGEDMYPMSHERDIVDARYVKNSSSENPDICALPLSITSNQIYDEMQFPLMTYDYEEIKKQTILERKEGVLQLQQVHVPLGHVFDMADAVKTALISSYMAREARITEWEGEADLVKKSIPSRVYSVRNGYVGRPQSFVVSGSSGCGKTVGINLIRNLYPRAIHHVIGEYEYIQIPILMVTALVGNMMELMLAIATAIDDIIGAGPIIHKRIRGRNVGMAASEIKEAIRIFHIGLIIIDECQFLRFDGSNASLENLIGISEETGCALGLIGNKELLDKMNRYPRFVGRTMLNRIEISMDTQINRAMFVKGVQQLWEYQWTKERTELTDEIQRELVLDSMYNIAILKALLMRIQFNAVAKYPKDGINAEYIHRIAEERFANMRTLILSDTTESEQELIEALRKNTNDMEENVKSLMEKARTSVTNLLLKKTDVWNPKKLKEIVTILKYFHITESQTKRALARLVNKNEHFPEQDIPFIVDEVKKIVANKKLDPAILFNQAKKKLDEDGEQIISELVKKKKEI